MDGVDRILEQWARERPELDTQAMGVFGRVARIAAIVNDAMERTYAQHGISRADFDVLATLRRSGEPFQLSPGALSSTLMLTTGGMTGRLNRLEGAGLVTRSADLGDRRALVVTLTDRGRELIDVAVASGVESLQELLAEIPAGQRSRLSDLLRDLLAAVTRAAPALPIPRARPPVEPSRPGRSR
jgi:DNA-binding MarR family transcriptional regulator